jgi:CheY-like chemotaxis protein
MLAHELRNPLQPIAHANALIGNLGGVHTLLPRLHEVIDRQVGHLSRLIEDLLDVSRISSGKITLKQSYLRMRDLIAIAVETSHPHIVEHKQSLQIDDPNGDVFVYGDPLRLAQILSNLLNNASKFSREGEGILLRTAVDDAGIHISVIDHGAGIAEELMPHVFTLFTQGAQSLDRSKGGLGIGLTLVRSLVELHGGSVRGASDGIGKGSQFTVTLPIARDGYDVLIVEPAVASDQPKRILLVEDNVDANELLCCFLETKGHIVSACYDGATAISMALAGHYDFLLCDIGLPGLDGFSVVRSIRSQLDGDMPVCVATSGYNQAEDRALALASGFDDYLVKPIDLNVLQELFEMHGR